MKTTVFLNYFEVKNIDKNKHSHNRRQCTMR